jgi:hypothetical protein
VRPSRIVGSMGAVKFVIPNPPDTISEEEARVLHEQLLTRAAFSATAVQAALKIQAGLEGGGDVDLTDDQKHAALEAFEQLHLDQRMTESLRWVEQGLKQSLGIDAY